MINAEIELYTMELERKVKVSVAEFHRRIKRLTEKYDVDGGHPDHWSKRRVRDESIYIHDRKKDVCKFFSTKVADNFMNNEISQMSENNRSPYIKKIG